MQNARRQPTSAQVECRACARFDSDAAWRAFPLLRSMSASDLARFMTTRWTDRVIEVRTCPQCGRNIARIVPPRD
jgi:hypothetical protein